MTGASAQGPEKLPYLYLYLCYLLIAMLVMYWLTNQGNWVDCCASAPHMHSQGSGYCRWVAYAHPTPISSSLIFSQAYQTTPTHMPFLPHPHATTPHPHVPPHSNGTKYVVKLLSVAKTL